MEELKSFGDWVASNPLIVTMGKYIAYVLIVLILVQIARRILKKRISNTQIRYQS